MLSKTRNNKTSPIVLFCFLILIPGLGYSDPRPPAYYSNNPIVAEVDGEVVHLDDLKNVRIQEALVQTSPNENSCLKRESAGKTS